MLRFNFFVLATFCIAIYGAFGDDFELLSGGEFENFQKSLDLDKKSGSEVDINEGSQVDQTNPDGSQLHGKTYSDVKEKKFEENKLSVNEQGERGRGFVLQKSDDDDDDEEPTYKLDDPEYRTHPPQPSTVEPRSDNPPTGAPSGDFLLPKKPEHDESELPSSQQPRLPPVAPPQPLKPEEDNCTSSPPPPSQHLPKYNEPIIRQLPKNEGSSVSPPSGKGKECKLNFVQKLFKKLGKKYDC